MPWVVKECGRRGVMGGVGGGVLSIGHYSVLGQCAIIRPEHHMESADRVPRDYAVLVPSAIIRHEPHIGSHRGSTRSAAVVPEPNSGLTPTLYQRASRWS